MRRLKLAVLITMMIFPFIVLMANDARYSQVTSGLCRANESVAPACDYPERHSREQIVTTDFYRHLRTYMGGDEGTSWSFDDYMTFLKNDGDNEAFIAADEAMAKIRQFNLQLVLSMGLSLVVATVGATIFVQQLARSYKLRRNRS